MINMKYIIIDQHDKPLYWSQEGVEAIIEFDTEADAREFAKSAMSIPFIGLGTCLISDVGTPLSNTINLTGKIPVANGDDVELKRWRD
jgi:hypothetical protein